MRSQAQRPDDFRRLDQIIRADPDLMRLLTVACRLSLPHWRLGGGCVYQTVWHALTGRPRRTRIKDYDLVYFDSSDLSWEAEDTVIQQVAAAMPWLPGGVEVRNHARVPVWFEEGSASHALQLPTQMMCSASTLSQFRPLEFGSARMETSASFAPLVLRTCSPCEFALTARCRTEPATRRKPNVWSRPGRSSQSSLGNGDRSECEFPRRRFMESD